ncbi:MAG TPA: hypothetical protein VE399_04565 [Gemmatimonadales bacterium]|nr:hypothetical protein [Gemmatimonadales bacterium]
MSGGIARLGAGLESSGIGASLKNIVSGSGRLIGFVASGLLLCWAPTKVAGQDTDTYDRSPPLELPRFTLRQIVTGSNDTLRRIPGPWFRAAMEARPESLARARYHTVAGLSGVAALEGKALESERFQHTMGLYRREELTSAAARTLEAIRSSIPGDTTRARFDRIFRWRGNWVADLHDAALAWAQTRSPGMTWNKARPALTAIRWLDPKDTLTFEAVPRAVYGLMLLATKDSTALATIQSDITKADPVSAEAVRLLLAGYAQGRRWYADALGFFETQPWIPEGAQGQSLAGLVRREWRLLRGDSSAAGLKVPAIRAHVFGYPQAVPQGLASNGAEDQHSTGYALVAALAATLDDPARTAAAAVECRASCGRCPAPRSAQSLEEVRAGARSDAVDTTPQDSHPRGDVYRRRRIP